jgi:hypothetical protein
MEVLQGTGTKLDDFNEIGLLVNEGEAPATIVEADALVLPQTDLVQPRLVCHHNDACPEEVPLLHDRAVRDESIVRGDEVGTALPPVSQISVSGRVDHRQPGRSPERLGQSVDLVSDLFGEPPLLADVDGSEIRISQRLSDHQRNGSGRLPKAGRQGADLERDVAPVLSEVPQRVRSDLVEVLGRLLVGERVDAPVLVALRLSDAVEVRERYEDVDW